RWRTALDVAGTLTIATGQLDASASNHSIRCASLNQTGASTTLVPRSGSLVMRGSSGGSIRATTTLNALRVEDPTETDLVAYWKFDAQTGLTARDWTGNGHTATLRGGSMRSTTVSSSILFDNGGSATFDGTNDFVSVPYAAALNPSSAITVSAWINATSGNGSYRTIVSLPYGATWASPWAAYALRLTTGNKLECWIDDYVAASSVTGGTDILAGTGWRHVAFTYDGATITLYRSGLASTPKAYASPINASTRALAIGTNNTTSPSEYFVGQIDDVRIYSRALTGAEIRNLANGRYVNGASGTASWTLAANLATTSLGIDAGVFNANGFSTTVTNLFTLQQGQGTYIAGSGTQTFDGGLTVSGSTFTGGSGTIDINGSFSQPATVDANGAVAQSGGSVTLSSGTTTLTGSFTRASSGTLAHNGGTMVFDGAAAGQGITSGGGTLNEVQITGAGGWTINDPFAAAGSLTMTNGAWTQAATGSIAVGGAWNHSAGTFTGNTTGSAAEMMRIGGAFALSGTASFTSTRSSLVVGGDFTVSGGTFTHNSGTVLMKSATSRTLTCSQPLGHVAFSDGLVSQWRFEEGATAALDASGYGHTATWFNGPAPTTTVKPTIASDNARALTFDGSDDYLNVADGPEFKPTDKLTVATWWRKPAAGASFTDEGGIFGRQSGTSTRGWSLHEQNVEGNLIFRVNHTMSSGMNVSFGGLTRDTWHHVAVTFNSTLLTAYLDGKQVSTNAIAAGTVVNPATGVLWIGRQTLYGSGYAPKFGGALDDLRFYDRDLPAADIKRLAAGRETASSIATFTLATDLTLAGGLTIGSGTLDMNSRAVGLAGDWRCGGVLVPGTSTVTFNGAATTTTITCGGQSFANVVIAGAGSTYTCSDAFRATGTFTQSAGTFVGNARPTTVGGSMSFNAGTYQATTDITTCGGDFSDAGGGLFVANPGVVRLTASSAKTLNMTDAFNHLWVGSGGDSGMVARFRLDEAQPGSVVDDVSAIVGTCYGTPTVSSSLTYTVAPNPYGLDFTGAESGTNMDYVQIATGSALDTVQNNDYSISAWFKPRSIPPEAGTQNRACYGVATKTGQHIGLFFSADGRFGMGARLTGGVNVDATSGPTYAAGSWYHLCGVFDRTNGTTALYVDGVRVGSTAFTAGTAAHAIYDAVPWRFGIANPSAVGEDQMWPADGFIDDVRFYSRALAASEARTLAYGGIDAAAGTATISLAAPLDVNGDVVLAAGTLSAGVHQINAAASWRNFLGTAAFDGGSATVVLDGASQQLYGSTTFNGLTKSVASAATLTFPVSECQTFTGTLTLNGALGQLLSIVSSTSGVQATIKPAGARACSYLSVKDSRNFLQPVINPTDSTNAGNTRWWFGPAQGSGNPMVGAPAVQ
ncbi:MAG TPA: LamG-like jellyroll fold domain-containing protein, partial [Planctomycetota bacterium]|nr:LamG-like jellyroll fold domain-containing protein [Planctomycetota bacterium]